jgi:hypothetical protein
MPIPIPIPIPTRATRGGRSGSSAVHLGARRDDADGFLLGIGIAIGIGIEPGSSLTSSFRFRCRYRSRSRYRRVRRGAAGRVPRPSTPGRVEMMRMASFSGSGSQSGSGSNPDLLPPLRFRFRSRPFGLVPLSVTMRWRTEMGSREDAEARRTDLWKAGGPGTVW